MLHRASAETTTVSFVSALVRWKRLAFALLLSGLFVCPPARSHAAGLQCPELTLGAMSNPLADPKRAQLVTTGNSTDLANEIYDLINRLQIERPNISYTELTNVLIAAYCPVVSNAPQLTEAEKWQRMRQFDAVLCQQFSADHAGRIADHCQHSASAGRLSGAQEPGCRRQSVAGAINGRHPDQSSREVAALSLTRERLQRRAVVVLCRSERRPAWKNWDSLWQAWSISSVITAWWP